MKANSFLKINSHKSEGCILKTCFFLEIILEKLEFLTAGVHYLMALGKFSHAMRHTILRLRLVRGSFI